MLPPAEKGHEKEQEQGMKIGLIDVTVTMSFGGIQTAVWELAKTLADLGHEIHVFGGTGDIRPELGKRCIGVHTFPFIPRDKAPDLGRRFQRIVERASFARHARKKVIELDLDWIVLTKPFDFFWPRLLTADSKTKFCYMSGGTSFFRGDRYLSKKIDVWVACSQFNAWQIQHHFKHFPQVIFNGVDIEKFSPRESAVRQTLNISPNTFLLVFAGRLVGLKGLHIAIKALQELKDAPVSLLIMGGGEEEQRLKSLAAESGVGHKVVFHPAVSHDVLPDYYAAADAGIFPSIADEAFGISIAEAMACARPVIASYIGGIPEVVGNEGTAGILVTPGDPQAITAAVEQLMALPDRGRGKGENARKRIQTLYTWHHSATRLLAALYHDKNRLS